MKMLLALSATVLLAGSIAACGSSGKSENATPASAPGSGATATTTSQSGVPSKSSAPSTATTTSSPAPASPSTGSGSSSSEESSSSSSTAKRYPHGDNSIQTYGKAGGEADKQAVTEVVKRYYAAVAADDGAGVCSLMASGLSKSIVQGLGRSPALHEKGCAGIVSLLFKHRPGQSPETVEVTGLRLNGDRGFALLRSKTMPSGEIPVDRESGTWKIGGLIGSALP